MLISYDVRIRKIMRSARNRRGYGWVYDSIQVHINSLLLNHSIENKQGGFVNALISARTSGAYSQLGKQSTHFKINSKVGMSTTVTSSYRGSNMIELYTCSKTKQNQKQREILLTHDFNVITHSDINHGKFNKCATCIKPTC